MDVTIFEQDGKVYVALSHGMPSKELAKETAKCIRQMAKVPRSRMRVVNLEEAKHLEFATPTKT